MPANSIRRSDDNIKEKYKKIAEAISKNKTVDNKFGEFGKAISLNQEDASSIPVFASNFINFSSFEKKVAEEQKIASLKQEYLRERAQKRRIIAGIDDIDLKDFDEDDENINIEDLLKEDEEEEEEVKCDSCNSPNCHEMMVPPELKKLKIKIYKCEDCGKKFKVGKTRKIRNREDLEYIDPAIEDEIPFVFNKKPKRVRTRDIFDENEDYGSGEPDIISSIETMLPEVLAKPNKKMNKTAGKIIKNLIGLLNIDENQKQWFNAQIDSGVLNSEIFMRNIKKSLQNGGN